MTTPFNDALTNVRKLGYSGPISHLLKCSHCWEILALSVFLDEVERFVFADILVIEVEVGPNPRGDLN